MDLLVTGFVRSSHGLDGFVKVESASGETSHIARLDSVYLRMAGSEDVREFEIESLEEIDRGLLIKFRGIDSPERAKALSGAELLVSRDMACPLSPGEAYVSDLCQCVLVYQGTVVGVITGVMEGGAGDLLEVTLSDGSEPPLGRGNTRYVPFRKEFVGAVDVKNKTVELMHRWILE